MATSTFDRKIEITDMASLEKLIQVINTAPEGPISRHPFTDSDRKRGDELLDHWLLRLKH